MNVMQTTTRRRQGQLGRANRGEHSVQTADRNSEDLGWGWECTSEKSTSPRRVRSVEWPVWAPRSAANASSATPATRKPIRWARPRSSRWLARSVDNLRRTLHPCSLPICLDLVYAENLLQKLARRRTSKQTAEKKKKKKKKKKNCSAVCTEPAAGRRVPPARGGPLVPPSCPGGARGDVAQMGQRIRSSGERVTV